MRWEFFKGIMWWGFWEMLLFWPRAVFVFTLLLCARHGQAQFFTPSLSNTFSYPGSTVFLRVNLQDATPPLGATSFQYTLNIPPGLTLNPPTGTTCSGLNCTSMSATPYTSGVVVTIPIAITPAVPKGNQPFSITSVVASSQGNQTPIPSPAVVFLRILPNTGTTPWFTVNVGSASCQGFKVAQTPIRVTWTCSDLFGASTGGYTADVANGGVGTSFFPIGVSSISGPLFPAPPNANLQCVIQMNGTPAAVTMLNGVSVPAFSAQYSCQGYTTTGQGVVSWP